MGIVNVTPDSFSDGGRLADPRDAADHAHRLVAEGADLLDLGGESSRPGSEPVPLEEELRRVLPVVEALAAEARVPISVDTTKAEVARRALEAGAAIINDITAMGADPEMARSSPRPAPGWCSCTCAASRGPCRTTRDTRTWSARSTTSWPID